MSKSKCCGAEVQGTVFDTYPPAYSYVCSSCDKPCEVWEQPTKGSTDPYKTPSPTNTILTPVHAAPKKKPLIEGQSDHEVEKALRMMNEKKPSERIREMVNKMRASAGMGDSDPRMISFYERAIMDFLDEQAR